LFINHRLFKYSIKGQELCVGLLVHKLEKNNRILKFFTDFWRLDYFPFENYEEDYYEFYQIEPAKGWPSSSKYMANYMSSVQLEGLRQKQIPSFGILPKVNLTNSKVVYNKRKQLRDFYLYAYRRSQTSHRHNMSIPSVGHGAFNISNFKRAVTVLQYDQVSPVLSQQFSLKDVE
jgi:hypothetical protein